jgi:hypothetical protein
MKKSTGYAIAIIMALAVTIIQSMLALGVPGMSTDEAYSHLRQVESIRNTGFPLSHDDLSPVGKRFLVTPLYDYVLTIVSFIVPSLVAIKVVPAIFAGILVVLVFGITLRLTQEPVAGLFAALALATMPALMGSSVNTASSTLMILSMTTLLLWQLMALPSPTSLGFYTLLIILLSFTHPSVALVLVGLLLYGMLLMIGEMRGIHGLDEILLFSTLFIVWSLIVRFKDALVMLGPMIVFQNIPSAMRDAYFSQLSVLNAVVLVGVLPFLFGSYIVYTYTFRERWQDIYLLMGFALGMGLLLAMGIVRPLLGVMFLGLVLSIMFGVWVKRILDYVKDTRFVWLRVPLMLVLVAGLVVFSLLPAWRTASVTVGMSPSQEELDSLSWMDENLPKDAVVLARTDEGFRVEALSHRRVVQDQDFILQKDAEQRFMDIDAMYKSVSEVDAITLLNKYGVTHIYVSPKMRQEFKTGKPAYSDDAKCFSVVYDDAALVLRSLCRVESR